MIEILYAFFNLIGRRRTPPVIPVTPARRIEKLTSARQVAKPVVQRPVSPRLELGLYQQFLLKEDTEIAQMGNRLLKPLLHKELSVSPASWLNDAIVENYLNSLHRTYPERKIKVVGSGNAEGAAAQQYFENISSHPVKNKKTQLRKGRLQKLQRERKALQAAETIFWPICSTLGGSAKNIHWYLLIIEKTPAGFTIKCLDGYNAVHEHERLMLLGKQLVQKVFPKKSEKIDFESVIIPAQPYTDDCGPAICFFAKKIAQGERFFKAALERKAQYRDFRLDIAKVLVEKDPAVLFQFGRVSPNPDSITCRQAADPTVASVGHSRNTPLVVG